MEKFCDFAEKRQILEGDKERIDDILNKNIIVTGYKIEKSKFKKNGNEQYVKIQFKDDEQAAPHVCFTGSTVLIDQLELYKEHIPFETQIKKINRYYTFC